jgi:hypothetical protein
VSKAPRILAALVVAVALVPSYAQSPSVPLRVVFNVTPHPSWAPGKKVLLSVDARRSAELGNEDIFFRQSFPGSYARGEAYGFDGGTSDCYPSDKDNPPSCSAQVPIWPHFAAGCQPVFTWSGGDKNGGVLCSAQCVKP